MSRSLSKTTAAGSIRLWLVYLLYGAAKFVFDAFRMKIDEFESHIICRQCVPQTICFEVQFCFDSVVALDAS